jgi:hypothetical protein
VAVRVGAWAAVHRKLVVAVIGAALTLAIQVWGTGNPWVSFAILAATSLGVYGAPNQAPPSAPPPRAAKTLIRPPATPRGADISPLADPPMDDLPGR